MCSYEQSQEEKRASHEAQEQKTVLRLNLVSEYRSSSAELVPEGLVGTAAPQNFKILKRQCYK